jgi:hypothetical protein
MLSAQIHLLLDSYFAHGINNIKTIVARLDVTLYYIQLGLTDEFELLEVTVFNVLRAQAKCSFHTRFHTNSYGRRTKQEVVADMTTTWSILGASVIEDT